MKFALHDFINGAIDRMVIKTSANGNGTTSARITFLPEKVYETSDELLIKYIKGEVGDCRQKSPKSEDLVMELNAHGIEYETKVCGSCAGARPSVFYNPFKIIEE